MKRYIRSNTTLSQGAYLLTRDGDIIETEMHVPSTTFVGRGIEHLVPTDAQFLLNQGKISDEDAKAILDFCLVEYLRDEKHQDEEYTVSVMDVAAFNSYAEMRYASELRRYLMTYANKFRNKLSSREHQLFVENNRKWYPWLQNNFVKVSVFKNTVEFRISSEDMFDWNGVIIDNGILEHDFGDSSTLYTVVRESSKGYKAYFLNATLDDILEQDDIVLSSTLLDRRVVKGELVYVRSDK